MYLNQSAHFIILEEIIGLGEGTCDLNKSIEMCFRILAWNAGRAWCIDAKPGTAAAFLTSGGMHSLG